MNEREYFTNSQYANYCKQQGYYKAMEAQAEIERFSSWRIHCSLVEKPLSLQDYWPLPSDKKVSRVQKFMSKETLERLRKKAHNLK